MNEFDAVVPLHLVMPHPNESPNVYQLRMSQQQTDALVEQASAVLDQHCTCPESDEDPQCPVHASIAPEWTI